MLPGLRALLVKDARPLMFIVDTRGLSLSQRGMQRVTSMGLDMTRAEFLALLEQAAASAPKQGCATIVFPAT